MNKKIKCYKWKKYLTNEAKCDIIRYHKNEKETKVNTSAIMFELYHKIGQEILDLEDYIETLQYELSTTKHRRDRTQIQDRINAEEKRVRELCDFLVDLSYCHFVLFGRLI